MRNRISLGSLKAFFLANHAVQQFNFKSFQNFYLEFFQIIGFEAFPFSLNNSFIFNTVLNCFDFGGVSSEKLV